jgi:hypothetical protein
MLLKIDASEKKGAFSGESAALDPSTDLVGHSSAVASWKVVVTGRFRRPHRA